MQLESVVCPLQCTSSSCSCARTPVERQACSLISYENCNSLLRTEVPWARMHAGAYEHSRAHDGTAAKHATLLHMCMESPCRLPTEASYATWHALGAEIRTAGTPAHLQLSWLTLWPHSGAETSGDAACPCPYASGRLQLQQSSVAWPLAPAHAANL